MIRGNIWAWRLSDVQIVTSAAVIPVIYCDCVIYTPQRSAGRTMGKNQETYP